MADNTFAARHTLSNADWITPAPIVEAAREVLGQIDLDPASDAEAQRVVKASRYFTVEDDGLQQAWWGRVFLNPPGGQTKAFWRKLLQEDLVAWIWIGYSLEQLQTLQQADTRCTPLSYPLCYPRARIAFLENEAKRQERIAKMELLNERLLVRGEPTRKIKWEADSPSHANYLAYGGLDVDRFARVFAYFGKVVVPR